ncbi:MAG: hypothetical protein JKY70_20090 [Mucilaginibacter sp.]|nr:hypothetical protein [Mucilaginibacter sp.]
MKEEKEDSIDKLFSRGLSDPGDNASYREEDWDALEAMLDGKKPKTAGISRNIIYLITTIAAMLLLVIGWAFFRPDNSSNTNQQAGNKKPHVKQDSGKYGSPVQQQEVLASSTLSAGKSNTDSADGKGRKRKSFFTLSAVPGNRIPTGKTTSIVVPHYTEATAKQDTTPPDPRLNNIAANGNKANEPIANNLNVKHDTTPPDPAINMAAIKHADSVINGSKKTELVSVVDDIKKPRKTVGTAVSYQPTFAMSIIASPDVNGVNGFNNTRVGTNAGLMLTMGVSKWTISTGAVYADKPYAAPFSAYSTAYKFATNPTEVYASCTVLDIPLNVGYQVYNKNRNKFSLGTGLSSYFMLRENYTYDYPATGTPGPATYNIRNKNQHIFGVLNLNATYQREINSRFGLAIQPYMKLPLTGIGYGKVNLRSAGVAVGATWNIISGKKPK